MNAEPLIVGHLYLVHTPYSTIGNGPKNTLTCLYASKGMMMVITTFSGSILTYQLKGPFEVWADITQTTVEEYL